MKLKNCFRSLRVNRDNKSTEKHGRHGEKDKQVFEKAMLSLLLWNQYDLNEVLGCKSQSSKLVTDCEIQFEIECEYISKIMCGQVKHVYFAHGKYGLGNFLWCNMWIPCYPHAEHMWSISLWNLWDNMWNTLEIWSTSAHWLLNKNTHFQLSSLIWVKSNHPNQFEAHLHFMLDMPFHLNRKADVDVSEMH